MHLSIVDTSADWSASWIELHGLFDYSLVLNIYTDQTGVQKQTLALF